MFNGILHVSFNGLHHVIRIAIRRRFLTIGTVILFAFGVLIVDSTLLLLAIWLCHLRVTRLLCLLIHLQPQLSVGVCNVESVELTPCCGIPCICPMA